jgi:DNA repair protein RadC
MAEISVGSLDASIVHPREVYKEAISASAASVILLLDIPPTAKFLLNRRN